MNNIFRTEMNTVVVDGIEYFEYPPPSSIVKAMENGWATKLVEEGNIRLRPLSYYRAIELPEIGDVNEGNGQWHMEGNPMEIGSVNEVYVWCGALSDTDRKTLLGLDGKYDTVGHISDVSLFTKRIAQTARDAGWQLAPHIGQVRYDRGREVTKEQLQALPWQSNVFQKSSQFAHQREYRLAFTEISLVGRKEEYVDLSLGDCSEFISIERT
ncbi:hypothetical protein [Candidatus Thiodiazotropha sp. CDECU1]|uniref:hypothetical protein n=1 Tax=Candidatus Thiodiazotropha sp. CDECU1 TaxID=3065865 RepID=UPI00292E5D08|nr:hypothetical protein [Candidatus Thiodiazotropha sp. CDECU1]